MVIFSQGLAAGETLARETARLTSLVADMERILAGTLPETIVTEAPPILDRWVLGSRVVPCLVGLSTGHPELVGHNRMISTSDVWLLSDDMAWARTASRWYRLGRPREHFGLDA